MSIDHSVEFSGDASTSVVINIVGLDAASEDSDRIHGTLFAYDKATGEPRFTCRLSIDELRRLYGHLRQYSVIADAATTRTGAFLELPTEVEALRAAMSLADEGELLTVLKEVVSSRLSRENVNLVLGRKDALAVFRSLLADHDLDETRWQRFFEQNDWIFGYGLRYCFLRILQREAHVSGTDLGGAESVISDFLLADRRFTKLVEIKRPDTPLFKSKRNRSDSWRLSDDLTDAVSQILAQQANWEVERRIGESFTKEGSRIQEGAVDVDCILVIGSLGTVGGSDQEREVKLRTFELFRRNLRNVEILTYDELYERAQYIVEGATNS